MSNIERPSLDSGVGVGVGVGVSVGVGVGVTVGVGVGVGVGVTVGVGVGVGVGVTVGVGVGVGVGVTVGVGVGVGVTVGVGVSVPPKLGLSGDVGVVGAGDTGEFCALAGVVDPTTVEIAPAAATKPLITKFLTGAFRLENRCCLFIVQNPAINPIWLGRKRGGLIAFPVDIGVGLTWTLDGQIIRRIWTHSLRKNINTR